MTTVEAVLEQVERHTKALETKLVCQAKLAEAEEVFVKIFGEIATDELLTSIVEGANAVCTSMITKSGSL